MRFIPEPRLGIDEKNSHAEEYIKYMDAVLEQDKWEKECAERNMRVVGNPKGFLCHFLGSNETTRILPPPTGRQEPLANPPVLL